MNLDLRYTETLPFPLERVWAAFTTQDALREWLMDSDFEPHTGRPFTFRCPPGPGVRGFVECKVLALEPMRRVVWSWHATDEGAPTTVTIEFEPVARGTKITLVHRGETAPDVESRTRHGWTVKLNALDGYLQRIAHAGSA